MEKNELQTVMRKVSNAEAAKVKELLSEGVTPQDAVNMVKSQHVNPEKPYILLAYLLRDSDDTMFIIKYSRDEIYNTIKDFIEDIDIHKSFVLTDSDLTLEEAMDKATVYKFMKTFQVEDDEFDIEDYNENVEEE